MDNDWMEFRVTNIDEGKGTVTVAQKEKPATGATEGGLVKRLYKNPDSDNHELTVGKEVWMDYTQQRPLYTQIKGNTQLLTHVWCPGWKANGTTNLSGCWLLKQYLHEVEEENEWGVVSP